MPNRIKPAKLVGLALLVAIAGTLWLGSGGMPIMHDLMIRGLGREAHFQVELAENQSDLQHGLMDRKELPDNAGMLFYFGNARNVSMWMKNTLVPLDMLFIGKDDRIYGIAANRRPLSEEIVRSQGPMIAVLEIRGGMARKLGIKVGDIVVCPGVLVERK